MTDNLQKLKALNQSDHSGYQQSDAYDRLKVEQAAFQSDQLQHELKQEMSLSFNKLQYEPAISRTPVTREDLIEVALKLQEAAALITQALGRLK